MAMNKLIVLAGNSLRNRDWGEACRDHFNGWFDETYLQYYDHWQTGKEIAFDEELKKLAAATADRETTYYVLAKSIGSIVTLLAVHDDLFTPNKCVFFGMPLEIASEQVFKESWAALETFAVPTIAFHNDEDPISYPFTKAALAEHAPETIELVTLKGDNHDYLDFADYESRITQHFNL